MVPTCGWAPDPATRGAVSTAARSWPRRCGPRPAQRRAAVPRPLAARLLHPPGRPQRAGALRGRPGAQRPLVRDPHRHRPPGRRRHLVGLGQLPGRRGSPRSPDRRAARRTSARTSSTRTRGAPCSSGPRCPPPNSQADRGAGFASTPTWATTPCSTPARWPTCPTTTPPMPSSRSGPTVPAPTTRPTSIRSWRSAWTTPSGSTARSAPRTGTSPP